MQQRSVAKKMKRWNTYRWREKHCSVNQRFCTSHRTHNGCMADDIVIDTIHRGRHRAILSLPRSPRVRGSLKCGHRVAMTQQVGEHSTTDLPLPARRRVSAVSTVL